MTLDQYAASATLRGANFVGSPQDVIDKILFQYDVFHHDRFLVQFSVGTLPHDKLMRSIELLGKEGGARGEAGARPPRHRVAPRLPAERGDDLERDLTDGADVLEGEVADGVAAAFGHLSFGFGQVVLPPRPSPTWRAGVRSRRREA